MRSVPALSLLAACAAPGALPEPAPSVVPVPVGDPNAAVPLYGGTMEAVPALGKVLAAVPEGGLLVLTDAYGEDIDEIELGAGTRPFRVSVAGERAWVTLRGTGEVVRVDLAEARLVWRTAVCADPRGLDLGPEGSLFVACAGGEIVELDDDGTVLRRVAAPMDLRDVVATDENLFVSRFRAAEVLRYDPVTLDLLDRGGFDGGRVAWRMRANSAGNGVVVVFQGEPSDEPLEDTPSRPGPYGGVIGEPCGAHSDAIVGTVGPRGKRRIGATLDRVVLPVDFLLDRFDNLLVVNGAAGPGAMGGDIVGFGPLSRLMESEGFCLFGGESSTNGFLQPSAVAEIDGRFVFQTAGEPVLLQQRLLWWRSSDRESASAFATFHRDPGSGVSCATCHPEGLDDGRVREFAPPTVEVAGPRRTMTLAGGLAGRAPYHWYGELATFDDVVEHTYVIGMRGDRNVDREALFDWLDRLPAVRGTVGDGAAVERGQGVFAEVGCAGCHSGLQYTNNAIADIGRGPLKVPSLVGLGTHEPLMHDGCAADIEARLTGPAECVGSAHGDLSGLSRADLDALAAFLRSL